MSWINEFPARIAALDAAHQRRVTWEVVPMGGANLLVDGRPMLAFCSNDYLGLASHPMLVRAATEGAQQFGIGSGGSPLVSGHSEANGTLQRQLAEFVQLPRALYFYAGYALNTGIIPALVGAGDALFSDSLNHACLIDGARLSRAKIYRYPHGDLKALEALLASCDAKRKLIISDAVFSMDGDIANVPKLVLLCERFDALLLLDDAHGFGVLGEQGRGTLSHFRLSGLRSSPRVLYMATLGKSAGVCGAFVAGQDPLIEWLLQTTRTYIFATAAPPLLACALSASVVLIEVGDERRAQLKQRIEQLRTGLADVLPVTGWSLGESKTAIQPLVVGSNEAALSVMDGLKRRGIWVPAIRPPTVPEGTARLRIAMSAAHTEADVDHLINALGEVAHHLSPEIGVLP